MSSQNSNQIVEPNKKDALNKFKMEIASQAGVTLKQGYNGEISARDAGKIGGQMVKRMIESVENGMK